jgi:hypothetical protein
MAYTADSNEPKVVATIGGIVYPRRGNPLKVPTGGGALVPSGADAPHLPVYRYSGGVDSSGNKEGGAERKLTQAIMANDLDETNGRALDKRAWQDGKLTAGRGFVPPAAPPTGGGGGGGGSDDPDADVVETGTATVEDESKTKKRVSRKKK